MEIVWRLEKCSIREILTELPEPQPHYNTVATLVKILVKKGLLKSELFGNAHRYSPTETFAMYREEHLASFKKRFFDNSLPRMLAHFAKKEKFSEAEKEQLIKIIKSNK